MAEYARVLANSPIVELSFSLPAAFSGGGDAMDLASESVSALTNVSRLQFVQANDHRHLNVRIVKDACEPDLVTHQED